MLRLIENSPGTLMSEMFPTDEPNGARSSPCACLVIVISLAMSPLNSRRHHSTARGVPIQKRLRFSVLGLTFREFVFFSCQVSDTESYRVAKIA